MEIQHISYDTQHSDYKITKQSSNARFYTIRFTITLIIE